MVMVWSAMIYSTSSLVGLSTTSGGALVGTFLSGSVWSNRSQLTHMAWNRGEFSPSWSLESIGYLSYPLFYKVYFQTGPSL